MTFSWNNHPARTDIISRSFRCSIITTFKMTLSVLTDPQIQGMLETLTAEELLDFQKVLKDSLHEYSTSTQSTVHLPERTTVANAATGTNTLFMPSANSAGNGVKGEASLPNSLTHLRNQTTNNEHSYHPIFR